MIIAISLRDRPRVTGVPNDLAGVTRTSCPNCMRRRASQHGITIISTPLSRSGSGIIALREPERLTGATVARTGDRLVADQSAG
jgi:hypothetical protein